MGGVAGRGGGNGGMVGAGGRSNLEHAEEDVQFNDGLSFDQVVHHRDVDVVDRETVQHEDHDLEKVAHLSGFYLPVSVRIKH